MRKLTHISDIVSKLSDISNKIVTLRQRIVTESGVDYRSQDARHVALDGIQQNLFACGLWTNSLLSLASKYSSSDSAEFREDEFLQAVGSNLTLEQTEDLMWNHLRLSLVVMVHFKIDSLFQNILRYLGSIPSRRGFWHFSNAILQIASIPDRGYEKDVFTVLANIRNSLHSNGIHGSPTMSVQIDGIDFEFNQGQRVECASWTHIVTAISANIDILEMVLLSNNIGGITDEIEDVFSASA